MAHSYREHLQLRCPRCARKFAIDFWLTVDLAEQPKILERVLDGSIHTFTCPRCKYQGEVDAPLLLVYVDGKPPLIFSPARDTPPERYQEQITTLVERLRQAFGNDWRDEWAAEILVVERDAFADLLSGESGTFQQRDEEVQHSMTEIGQLSGEDQEIPQIEAILAYLSQIDRNEIPDVWAILHLMLADAFLQNPSGSRSENLEQAILHCIYALEVFTPKNSPQEWATAQYYLGDAYFGRIEGERAANMEESLACYLRALTVFTPESSSDAWADTHYNLARVYYKRIHGERAENLEQVIEHYQRALEVITREHYPEDWADIMHDLGAAYGERIRGERAENVEHAIECYNQALEVTTREDFPVKWAQTQNNLGAIYLERLQGERGENLELAITHLQQALEVRTRENFPAAWATTRTNLASVYAERVHGVRAENLERAIEHYEQALEVMSREDLPEKWADIHFRLGNLYYERIYGERADNIERSIAHCQEALKVRTRVAFPEQWALIQDFLGSMYSNRKHGERAENLEQSLSYHHCALGVYTRDAFPEEWAKVQINLGVSYARRIRGERAENLELAITFLQLASEVCTRDAFPEQWAMTRVNLGFAYVERIHGERVNNLEQAIAYLQQAVEVYTREAFPEKWATVQNSLGEAYRNRIRGDRAANLELAITHFHLALEVFTRAEYSESWATAQVSLGAAYRLRIRGELADNVEQSIEYYRRALEVFTLEAFPEQWALIQRNLGDGYRYRVRGEQAENRELAIEYCQQALKVYTRSSFPQEWAGTHHELAVAYERRVRGEQAENLELAIHHAHLALEIYTREAFPERWAGLQNDLASFYGYRTVGEKAENLEQAMAYCQGALEVFTREAFPERWAIVLFNLATIYLHRIRGERTHNIEKAIEHYRQALEVYQLAVYPADRQRTLQDLGDLYFNEHNWEEAHRSYAGSIEAGDTLLAAAYTEVGRQSEVKLTSHLYAHDSYCLLQLEQYDEALVRLEQGKTRLLVEALALDEVNLSALPDDRQRSIRVLRQAVRELEAEQRLPPDTPHRGDAEMGRLLSERRAELNRLIEVIRVEHPDFFPVGLDLATILALAPEGGALVAPLITSQGSAVFVVPYGLKTVSKADVIPLDAFYSNTLRTLLWGSAEDVGWIGAYAEMDERGLNAWMESINKLTGRLWETLFQPVHERLMNLGLAPGAPIVLIPQGGLGLLPLHATWHEVDGQIHFLLDDVTVIYAPSILALNISLQRLQDARRHVPSMLAVINPTADLPYTSLEGSAIATLFPALSQWTLAGSNATKEALLSKVAGYSYLHFACHGSYNWQDVLRSQLLLAERKPLDLSEIISPRFDLNAARLVTLSACETGLIEFEDAPDEYIGLPAGFLQAGSPATISSLWAVDDFSTALLMESFYRYHLVEGQGIAAALRNAQLWLRSLSVGEVSRYLEQWYGQLHGRKASQLLQWKIHYRYLTQKDPDHRPFEHPYYWAAFTVNGL